MPAVSFTQFPRPEDLVAHDWVFAEVARKGGRGEAVYIYHQDTGAMVAGWHAAMAGANLDPDVEGALRDQQPLVLHHNHPSNGSFIDLDLQTLVGRNPHYTGLPGLATMWAHGNGGPHYRIALTDPAYAEHVIAVDKQLTGLRAKLNEDAGGHEIYASGWRHLVCLCLEAKGYVAYDYDLTGFPNYEGREYLLAWASARLTMKAAFPIACQAIVRSLV
jgi:hypothetical protein